MVQNLILAMQAQYQFKTTLLSMHIRWPRAVLCLELVCSIKLKVQVFILVQLWGFLGAPVLPQNWNLISIRVTLIQKVRVIRTQGIPLHQVHFQNQKRPNLRNKESVTISIYKCLWFKGKIKVGHCSLDSHVSFPE